MREDEVHYAVRQFLRHEGWTLIAGQYPNGSDDELPILNVKDPAVARDDSPDPRRHALDKFVPDLVALKERMVLVVEMKPTYDTGDKEKLMVLLSLRFEWLIRALEELSAQTPRLSNIAWRHLCYVPALGFSSQHAIWSWSRGFALLMVENLNSVSLHLPTEMNGTGQESLQSQVESIDWSFSDSETQSLTHAVHRYSGKFIPAVARKAIELLSQPGETVLDPFAGSGTTLLEAMLLGRNAVGVDLNPLACLVSSVKTTVIPEKEVRATVREVCSKLACFGGGDELPFLNRSSNSSPNYFRYHEPWYRKWFYTERLKELIFIKDIIDAEVDQARCNMLLVVFSDILRAASNANGGYPNVMFDKRREMPPPVVPRFVKRLAEIADAVISLAGSLPGSAKCEVLCGDAAALPVPNESADAIVTHPPYIGSVPYAEYGQLSLKWLGHDPKELDDALLGGRRQRRGVKERFVEGYEKVFSSCYRALKPGRHLFALVGNPLVHGERVNLAHVSKACAQQAGFSLAAETMRRAINRRANLMGDETILIFSKPKEERQPGLRSNGLANALCVPVVTAEDNSVCQCEK